MCHIMAPLNKSKPPHFQGGNVVLRRNDFQAELFATFFAEEQVIHRSLAGGKHGHMSLLHIWMCCFLAMGMDQNGA